MTRRWVLAGTGSRGIGMFARPLVKEPEFKGHSELVGLFDMSTVRMNFCKRDLDIPDIPTYTNFDKMLDELKPDGVIIATKDVTHTEYLLKAMARDLDVACEKPVCTTEKQCVDLLNAYEKTDARVLVTHNVRYSPAFKAIRKTINDGRIGKILTMHYREMLDRIHGADYFRRWHGRIANSGGLMIHKASHHFDILNYINGNELAETMSAMGDLAVYGKSGPYRSKRCMGCPHADECEYYIDLADNERAQGLYIDAEDETGYIRDGCVYADDIDIQDRIALEYRYANGVLASYTLCAFAMWEGAEVHIQGETGLIEYTQRSRTLKGAHAEHGTEESAGHSLKLFSKDEGIVEIEIEEAEGSHGGADPGLRREFFIRDRSLDPTPAMASLPEAVQAVLVGLAANRSIQHNGAPESVQSPIA